MQRVSTSTFLGFATCLFAFSLVLLPSAYGQTGRITGTVIDAETGVPLPGVNVVIEGTQRGASTDADGHYTIQDVAPGTYSLRASFIGYTDQLVEGVPVRADETTTQDFQLVRATSKLEEVVVIGYGEQSRATLTTSVSKLDTTALQNIPYANVASALQGSIPGLRVQRTTGQPGAAPRIILRGGTSINNPSGAEPLIIVDGVVKPSMSDISALNIESIQVLKDAASTAIYGARASNGVIIVTTKSGQPGQTRVTYTSSLTTSKLRKRKDVLTARQYIKFGRLGVAATGERHPEYLYRLDAPIGFGTGNDLTESTAFTTQYLTDENRHLLNEGWESMPDPLNPSKTIIFNNTDWQDILFQRALTQNHHISVSGGNQDATFNFGFGYLDAQGIAITTGYERISLDMGGELQARDNLSLGAQVNFSHATDNTVFSENWIFRRAVGLPPTAKLRYQDGTLAPGQNASLGNPLYYLNVFERQRSTSKLTLALNGLWGITPNLTFEPSLSLYVVNGIENAFNPKYRNGPTQIISSRSASASHGLRWQREASGVFTYNNTFGGAHNVELMAGASYYDRRLYDLSASGRGAATDIVPTLNASAEPTSVYSFTTYRKILGGFTRVTYDYKRKYLFSASARYDGATNLGANNKWAFFPAVSAGWNMHEEAFWSAVPSLFSTFKLRASYGVTGNISGLSDFHAQGLYSVGAKYAGNAAIQNNRLANSELRWERSTSFDIGFDLGLYEDRISLIFDYYRRITRDLLTSFRLPTSTGFTSILTNLGALQNRGVEFELGADILTGQALSWNVSFNAAWTQNKILRLPENGNENNRIGGLLVYDSDLGEYVWVGGLQEGQPLGNMYSYKQLGIYPTDEAAAKGPKDMLIPGPNKTKVGGDAIFADLDGNGMIDTRDQVYVGNRFPDWTGGLSSSLSYKNLSLIVRADFGIGHTIINGGLARMTGQTQGDINGSAAVLRSWQEPGDQTDIPRYYWADQLAQNNILRGGRFTSYYYEDGDFLALREVTLSYRLPGKWLNHVGLQGLRVYVTGSNLGYLTAYRGQVPDYGGRDNGRYPIPRSITIGTNISL